MSMDHKPLWTEEVASPFLVRRGNIGYVLNRRLLESIRDNHLREEDICLLQTIKRGEGRRFTVMVHLLPKARRASRSKGGDVVLGSNSGRSRTSTKAALTSCVKDEPVDGTSDGSERSGYLVLGSSVHLTQAQEKVVAEKVKAVRSQAPIYVAAIDQSNLSSALDLGTTEHAAANGHLPDGKQALMLCQARWSKAWRIEVRNRRIVPSGGWREFTADNCLREG